MFENLWCTNVAVKAANVCGTSINELPEYLIRTLKLIALGLKEKGLSKSEAVRAIQALSKKYGGLRDALHAYAELFGIGVPGEQEASATFGLLTNSIAESLGVGSEGAEAIRSAALRKGARLEQTKSLDSSSYDGVHEPRDAQRMEIADSYPEPMRSWILSGEDADELLTGQGRFGSRNNPIPVNGQMGEIKYLAKLRTKEGEPICFHRVGSEGSDATDRPVDKYEIISVDGSEKLILFFDFYHPRRSCLAPPGFYLEKANIAKGDSAWGYGVPHLVPNFPVGLPDALVKEYGRDLGTMLAKEFEKHLLRITFGGRTAPNTPAVEKNPDEFTDLDGRLERLAQDWKHFFERFRRDPDLDALREQGSVIESAVEECFVYARRRGLDAQEQRALAQKARLYAFLASRHDHHHLDEQALDYYEEAIQISERPEPFVTWSLRKANLLRRLNRDDEELEELEGIADVCGYATGNSEPAFLPFSSDKARTLKTFHKALTRAAELHRKKGNYEAAEGCYETLTEYVAAQIQSIEGWVNDQAL